MKQNELTDDVLRPLLSTSSTRMLSAPASLWVFADALAASHRFTYNELFLGLTELFLAGVYKYDENGVIDKSDPKTAFHRCYLPPHFTSLAEEMVYERAQKLLSAEQKGYTQSIRPISRETLVQNALRFQNMSPRVGRPRRSTKASTGSDTQANAIAQAKMAEQESNRSIKRIVLLPHDLQVWLLMIASDLSLPQVDVYGAVLLQALDMVPIANTTKEEDEKQKAILFPIPSAAAIGAAITAATATPMPLINAEGKRKMKWYGLENVVDGGANALFVQAIRQREALITHLRNKRAEEIGIDVAAATQAGTAMAAANEQSEQPSIALLMRDSITKVEVSHMDKVKAAALDAGAAVLTKEIEQHLEKQKIANEVYEEASSFLDEVLQEAEEQGYGNMVPTPGQNRPTSAATEMATDPGVSVRTNQKAEPYTAYKFDPFDLDSPIVAVHVDPNKSNSNEDEGENSAS